MINLCAGGETLLSHKVLPVIKALVDEGHYVMIVTYGTVTKHLKEICETFSDEDRRHISFKFSFHYMELKRLDLMDMFFNNVRMMRDAGCAFTCELTPYDELIPYIKDIKNTVKKELGAYCHVTIARDDRTRGIDLLSDMSWDKFIDTWGEFESELFDFKKSIFYKKRNEFCYAGDWTLWINLSTGQYQPCNCGPVMGNIYTDDKIKFRAIGKCRLPHCYNGHAWLAWGAIPGFSDITYADERDRITENGEHWLTDEFQEVYKCKLENTNKKYSCGKRAVIYSYGEVLEVGRKLKKQFKKVIMRK